MTSGVLGEFFTALAAATAATSAVSYFQAGRSAESEMLAWRKWASTSFLIHIFSVLGIIATLFYMIATHQYQYYYVWDHSSNELPVYYMISCFWDGQEGSFLLWIFWHAILGGVLMRNKSEFRDLAMSVVASIQVILGTMILGAYYPEIAVKSFLSLAALVPAFFIAKDYAKNKPDSLPQKGLFHLASLVASGIIFLLIWREQDGFYSTWSIKTVFASGQNILFSLLLGVILAFFSLFISFIPGAAAQKKWTEIFSGMMLVMLALIVVLYETTDWKLGSSPFILLKDAMPDSPVYKTDPNFIPANGNGLNPLLQNYWMVIHPPTLFLGFAASLIPFAFVVAGLIKGKYDEWIKPARTWLLFSVMILGIGIIMGGYWAYETLNFGGYWNWDPVENASFVPWLTGIAAIHTLLLYQRNKSYLRLSMGMIAATFLLVLYSTFLTRSGILGETSVHTFTDLGLSGQLLALIFAYLVPIIILFALRWKAIPNKEEDAKIWSIEFFLFLGALVFIFAAAEISFATSLPVFNKIFGTHIAPPPHIQFFYYKWNVWFAILFGVLSGIAQFLWWRKKDSLANALYRPFVFACIAGSALILGLAYVKWDFHFTKEFDKLIAPGNTSVINYLSYVFMAFSEEILFFSSLFAIAANLDILFSFLKGSNKGLKVAGGTITHIGFALMLIGMLLSSGYDKVISTNLLPEELQGFPDEEKNDNVLLVENRPKQIKDFMVSYKGKKMAKLPLSDITILEENPFMLKLKFTDSLGDVYGITLPRNPFVEGNKGKETAPAHQSADVNGNEKLSGKVDEKYLADFLHKNVEYLKPGHLNGRTYYEIEFVSLKDSSKRFTLWPETEMPSEEQKIAHPARKIFAERDIYTHINGFANEEEAEPQYKYHEFKMGIKDTIHLNEKYTIQLDNLSNLSQLPELQHMAVAAAANLKVFSGTDTVLARPVYTIDEGRKPGMVEAPIEAWGLNFAFVDIDPKAGIVTIQVQEQTNAGADYVVLKAIEKPWVNVLWLGTFILSAGFGISIYRRRKERL